jgi:hypothetical protein
MNAFKQIAVIAALFSASAASAQETGTIKGYLTDENGKNMPYVGVALLDENKIIEGTSTDDNGAFSFKSISPGTYDLKFSFLGYKEKTVKSVEVSAGQITSIYRSLKPEATEIGEVVVTTDKWEKPVFNSDFSTISRLDRKQIEDSPVPKNDAVALAVSISSSIIPTADGKDVYMRGSRRGTTAYYIDGNKIVGDADVPGQAISGMEVLAGGVPAEYGDCTGGLVIITTKDYKTEMRRKRIKATQWAESQAKPASKQSTEDEE